MSLCTVILPPPICSKFEEVDNFSAPNGNEGCKISKPLHNLPSAISLD